MANKHLKRKKKGGKIKGKRMRAIKAAQGAAARVAQAAAAVLSTILEERDTFTLLLLIHLLTNPTAIYWQSSTMEREVLFGEGATDDFEAFAELTKTDCLTPSDFEYGDSGVEYGDSGGGIVGAMSWMGWGVNNVLKFLYEVGLLSRTEVDEDEDWSSKQETIIRYLLHINNIKGVEGECRRRA